MKKPELLAPAGNMECLKAAIAAGCDAVYLGGYMFGARSFANNFSNEELIEAIRYAHLYNVKVYVTTNIIVYEDEVETFMKYIAFLIESKVDAIIIQDLGMLDLVRKTYPDFEIHASTQMHIHNLDGVKLAQKLGLKRCVIARETPIEVIRNIKKNVNIELEVFIQGALCVSYSGQCFMSTLIGNRSGNRGTCAQCCRQKYTLESNNKKIDEGYLISTKDLNTLDNIGKLIECGVDSLKIEGRMKRKEYVYFVTALYRKAIDSYVEKGYVDITKEDIYNLKKLFNREFTKGFLFHEDNNAFINKYRPNHMGIPVGKVISSNNNKISILLEENVSINDGLRIVGDDDYGFTLNVFKVNNKIVKEASKGEVIECIVKDKIKIGSKVLKTSDYLQLQNINELINNSKRKVMVEAEAIFKKNQKPTMIIKCDNIKIDYTLDYDIAPAQNHPTTKEDITKQLEKIKDTVYQYSSLNIIVDDNIFMPVSKINELRRETFLKLDNRRLERPLIKKCEYKIELKDFKEEKKKSVLVDSITNYNNIDKDYDTLYLEEELFNKIDDPKKVLKLPRVLLEHPKYKGPLLVGELGSLYAYNDVITDFSFNVVNSYTVALLHSLGASKVTLSYELDYEQTKKIVDNYHKRYHKHPNLEVIVYTYPEAMITKYNLYKDYHYSNLVLKDRFDNKYKLKDKKDYMLIYNFKPLKHTEDYYKIGVNSIRYEEFF